jgi:hypothetical protein
MQTSIVRWVFVGLSVVVLTGCQSALMSDPSLWGERAVRPIQPGGFAPSKYKCKPPSLTPPVIPPNATKCTSCSLPHAEVETTPPVVVVPQGS